MDFDRTVKPGHDDFVRDDILVMTIWLDGISFMLKQSINFDYTDYY